MAEDYAALGKRSIKGMVHRRLVEVISCLGLFIVLTNCSLFFYPQVSFAQLSSSSETSASLSVQGADNELAGVEAARQQYLNAWNNTAFSSQFDVFVAEESVGFYGQYREHVPANVFRPGETIVLYIEPVGFGHQPIIDTTGANRTESGAATSRTLYLIDMTADIIGFDSSGAQVFAFEDVPVTDNFISHSQNTEIPMTLTVSQEEPFPVGDYMIRYIVHDQVTGQSFQIDRQITIDDNAVTGAAPLPDIGTQNSTQSSPSQGRLEERSQPLEP